MFTKCLLTGTAVKCFACEFNRNACPILGGCPPNRDRCSVRRFNHWATPVVDCPGKFCTNCLRKSPLIRDPIKRNEVLNKHPLMTFSLNLYRVFDSGMSNISCDRPCGRCDCLEERMFKSTPNRISIEHLHNRVCHGKF